MKLTRCLVCDEILWRGVLLCPRCARLAAAVALVAAITTLVMVWRYS